MKIIQAESCAMSKLLIINGPNLNLLGTREPEIYGAKSLLDIEQSLQSLAQPNNDELAFLQSNAEHEIVDAIQESIGNADIIIINPAAFTHTSVAIRDALLATQIPFIELHLSNVYAREEFRQLSYLSDIAIGTISGFGAYGYELAYLAAKNHLTKT